MKSLSNLMGYIGKSGGRTNTPEDTDTCLSIPGVLNLVLEVPYPNFSIFSAPLPGGQNTPVNSWIYGQEFLAGQAGASPVIAILGPGIWDIDWKLILVERGIVSDDTCNCTLSFFDTLTGTTAILGHINAKFNAQNNQSGHFRALVTAESTYSFARATTGGLVTSTSLFYVYLQATRLF